MIIPTMYFYIFNQWNKIFDGPIFFQKKKKKIVNIEVCCVCILGIVTFITLLYLWVFYVMSALSGNNLLINQHVLSIVKTYFQFLHICFVIYKYQ